MPANMSVSFPLFSSVSKATFFPIVPQNSVNINVNYVLHISKEFPVCEVIRKELHKVVYPKGKVAMDIKHIITLNTQTRITSH